MPNGIYIRNTELQDLDSVVALENRIWPAGTRAPKEKFQSRLEVFPPGFFLAFKNSHLIGASTSEIIRYQPGQEIASWEEITDDGWIRKTHHSQGNALYVVSLGALSRSGAGSALLQAQKRLTRKLDLDYLVLDTRIPNHNPYRLENGCNYGDLIFWENNRNQKRQKKDSIKGNIIRFIKKSLH